MSEATSFEAGCPSGLAPSTRQRRQIDFDAFLQIRQGARHLDLAVRGAKCGGCISKIEKTLIALPGVQAARLNLSNGQLRVSGSDQMQANAVAETLIDLGYGISARGTDGTDKARASEERSLLIAMAVAGFAAANIMLLSVSVWGGAAEMGAQTRRAFHVFSGLIAFPVILFSGQHFFRSAWSALSHRRVNMDVPISLAVWLAFGTSVWETAMGGEHAYFDACVMLLFFLLIGRFLDARLRRRAYAAAHDLAALQNQSVTRLGPGGAEAVRADEIRAGDRILVAPGERAIVDIDLIRGRSDVDESLVTGESLPRSIGPGARLYSGSINLGGALEGVAVSAAGESLLADIANLLEAGEQRRSTYRKISDRAVSLYVPFVHTTALLTFLGWLAAGADLRTATLIAVSTLIITCPCALALAAPVAQVVASSRLFQQGIFLKSGDALERLASVDHIVFDKTGTLTLGSPKWLPDPTSSRYLADAACLARASRHPLSAALVEVAGAGPVAAGTEETAGRGLCATIDGEVHKLGSAAWVEDAPDLKHSGPVLWYRAGTAEPIAFRFEDAPQAAACEAIDALQQCGLSIEILSGDRRSAVETLAHKVGVSHWTACATPQQKAARLEALKADGKRVLMVGDGLNDAAALSLAHAALSPGGAMDISQSASDAVYTGDLSAIPRTLRIARHARRAMVENFGLAALYNVIAVPIAITGHVTPLIAAIAMSASSLIVTLNALRPRLGGDPI